MSGTTIAPAFYKFASAGQQQTKVVQFLDTVGDGSGTKNANGNYASTAATFKIQPSSGVVYRLETLRVTIVDTAGMIDIDYGNITSGLSTGLLIRVKDDDSVLLDLTGGINVVDNKGWQLLCDMTLNQWGTTNEILSGTLNLRHENGPYIRLDGSNNERLEVVCNDNMTGLIAHYFKVDGYIE